MHSCIAIITEQFPTNAVLHKVLAPFNSELFYEQHQENEINENDYPQFTWDSWVVGGRYGGILKLKVSGDDPDYRWAFYSKEPRAGRLYRSMLCEKRLNDTSRCVREEEYYDYLGFSDGYIRVDGCKVKDVIDFADTVVNNSWGFIGRDGTAYSRSHWNGKTHVDDDQYEEKVRSAIKDADDCYVCYVDIHD